MNALKMAGVLPPARHDIAESVRDLAEFGVTRLEGALDPAFVTALRARLVEQAAAEREAGIAYLDNGNGSENQGVGPNQRVWNLISKGEVFRDIATHPAIHALMRALLGPDLLLFSLSANIACKGGEAQALHGDQTFVAPDMTFPVIANTMVMLDDITEDMGATRVVPGSHRSGIRLASTSETLTTSATGRSGTIMAWDGRTVHGTGANLTDRPRHGLLVSFCRPYMRQQENYALSLDRDVLDTCSPDLLKLLGFETWYTLGFVDGASHGVRTGRPQQFPREMHLEPARP